MFYFDENNDVVYITDGKKIVYRRYNICVEVNDSEPKTLDELIDRNK